MNRTILVTIALLVVPLTGCLSPATDAINQLSVGDAQKILPHLELSDAHDHKNISQHESSWNMEQIGWDPIAPDTTKFGRYNHVTLHGNHAFVTAYALEAGGAPGLAIYDITNDTPLRVGTLETPELTPIDVHVSEDGKYAVLGGHRDNRVDIPAGLNTCTGTPNLDVCTPFAPGGVIVVDVEDPTNPTVVDSWKGGPSGAHTAKIHVRDGVYHVYIASYGFSYASRVVSAVEIVMLASTPVGLKLQPVAHFAPSERSGNDGEKRVFVHDMYIEPHPNGKDLMYVSYWDGGVVIADVTNPHSPTELTTWRDFDIGQYGNIHFARPIGEINGVHLTYAAPEFGSAEHAGEAYILDTTDPAAPKLLGKWVLPGNPINDEAYRFSPHNFDPLGTKIVYAHYHGGIWVLDFADPANPIVTGYAMPTVPKGQPAFNATEDAPKIWAAQWAQDGTIWASDIGTGLYHYRMMSENPGTPPYSAFIN